MKLASPQTDVDVIISGAGVIGNCLACSLLQQGLRVALIEARPANPVTIQDNTDLRVFAITRMSENLLRSLGVWQHLPTQRLGRFDKMQVWADQGQIEFDVAKLGESALGYIIEQQVLQYGFQQVLQQFPALQHFSEQRIEHFYPEPQQVRIKLSSGHYLSSRLLISAEGRNSHLRQLANIPVREQNYHQHALVTTLQTELPHQHTARQRFLAQGPLAFLPLADPHQVSIVWSLPSDRAFQLQQMQRTEFEQQLAKKFQHRLGQVSSLDKPQCFPLSGHHAQQYVQNRFLLIGDAAHGIHPLAGQGVNLGLLDVACLHDVLTTAQSKQRDIGAYAILRRYERARKADNLRMLYLMAGLNELFRHPHPLVKLMRNHGLKFANQLNLFKRQAMVYAMGQRGNLPSLMRPM